MPPRVFAPPHPDGEPDYQLRRPTAADGPAITQLIASCPPLDGNSAYCNLLQCSHFAAHCVVAQQADAVVGWVSGYRPPSEPASLFVWQVAVAAGARGRGLAGRMIETLLDRHEAADVTHLIATVTDDNHPSWALFEGLARRWSAPLSRSVLFDREIHFANAHATEWQARIGPLSR